MAHLGALVLPWLRLATAGYALSPYVAMYAPENPLEKRESHLVPRRIARAMRFKHMQRFQGFGSIPARFSGEPWALTGRCGL